MGTVRRLPQSIYFPNPTCPVAKLFHPEAQEGGGKLGVLAKDTLGSTLASL